MSLELRLALWLALLGGVALGVHLLLASERAQGAAACQAAQERAAAVFNAATAASNAAQAAREAKAVQDGQDQLRTVAAAAGGALGSLERLRQRAAADAQRNRLSCAAAAASAGSAASTSDDLQPDLLGRLGEAAGQLAAYADRARIAGQTCVGTVTPQ